MTRIGKIVSGLALAATLGVVAAPTAAHADRDAWNGRERHWEGEHRGWRGPRVVVAPEYHYPPAPVYYAPPPVYYAPPPQAYYAPGINLGIGLHLR